MSELKAGYWRHSDGSLLELFCERDGTWFGRNIYKDGSSRPSSTTEEAICQWWEYLGPTLPPDPGPGWRLLKKEPEPEAVQAGDEYGCVDVSGVRWVVLHIVNNTFQHPEFWYRRRDTPSPPQPPDGWELLPDGTEPHVGFKRYVTFTDSRVRMSWANRWDDCIPSFRGKSGPFDVGYIWYARRIEPQWERTMELRHVECAQRDKHSLLTPLGCPNVKLQQKWTCGEQSEWRDVGVAQ